MEFANFALIELAGALEAQRDHDRRKSKWLLLWRQLEHQSGEAAVPAATDEVEPLRTAA